MTDEALGEGYGISQESGVICLDVDGSIENIGEYCRMLIEEVFRKGFDVNNFPVIYRISEGIWERILVKDGHFVGFQTLGETTNLAEATDLALLAFKCWKL